MTAHQPNQALPGHRRCLISFLQVHRRAGSDAPISLKAAPFPEPDEELYGVAANSKLYVIGGWGDGKARGVTYEYDPATDQWTKKKSMPRPAHHAALAAANGKIYVMGGFVAPQDTQIPVGGAGQPIDDAWEYDPAADSCTPSTRSCTSTRLPATLGSIPGSTSTLMS